MEHVQLKGIILDPLCYIIYTFFAMAYDCAFPYTESTGIIILLIVPVWGVFFFFRQKSKLSFLHWYSILLCILMLFIVALHDDLFVVWCFPLKLWCFLIAFTTASVEMQKKIFSEVMRFTVYFILFVHFLSFLCFYIVDSPVIQIIPEYFIKIIMKAVQRGRFVGFLQNSNTTAIISMLGWFASIYCIFYLKKTYIPAFCVFLSTLIVVFLTNSRGTMLSMLVFTITLFGFYFSFQYRNFDERMRLRFFLLLVCIFVFFIVLGGLFFFNRCFQDFILKMLRVEIEGNPGIWNILVAIGDSYRDGSGRNAILQDNLSLFKDSPILGVPIHQLRSTYSNVVHNGFLLAFFTLGIPAGCVYSFLFLLLLVPFLSGIRRRNKRYSGENFFLSFLIAVIVSSFLENTYEVVLIFSHNFASSFFYLIYAMAYTMGKRGSDERDSSYILQD